MVIEELKTSIEQKNINDNTIIFVWHDSQFIAEQYIEEIAKIKNLPIQYIESLPQNSIFFVNNSLLVYRTDELNEISWYAPNLIIIAKKISKSIDKNYVVNIPKLEPWQIFDYAKTNLSSLQTADVQNIVNICKNNIYRIQQEVDKLKYFSTSDQKLLYDKMIEEDQYSDLVIKTIFDFTNALQSFDKQTLNNIYKHIKNCDIEPLGIVTILYKNYLNMIKVKFQKYPNEENTGLKSNQIYAIKKASEKWSYDSILEIFKIINKMDFYLKSGYLDESKIIDYIVISILTIGGNR